jgi:hypothetical protein
MKGETRYLEEHLRPETYLEIRHMHPWGCVPILGERLQTPRGLARTLRPRLDLIIDASHR